MIFVLDIDETLADNRHRAHYVEKTPKDWEGFLDPARVLQDKPLPAAQRVVAALKERGVGFVFLTGRNETLRDVTSRWLLEHFDVVADDTNLYMRPEGNLLKPTEYKGQQLSDIARNFGRELIFVDDDPYMLPLYQQFGVAMQAPACWDVLMPRNPPAEPEMDWRK